MFSLVNIISWVSETFTSTQQADHGDNKTEKTSCPQVTDEGPKVDHAPLTGRMVDTTNEPPQYDCETPGNGLMLDQLRISDSEDWDEEIDSMSTTIYITEHPFKHDKNINSTKSNGDCFGYDTKTSLSTSNTIYPEQIKKCNLSPVFPSPNNSSSNEKQYFDGESFAPLSNQNLACSSEENSFSIQTNQNYGHKEIAYNISQSNYVSNKPQIENVEKNTVSKQLPFAKDRADFQHSLEQQVQSEPSLSNSDHISDYENMFQWDYMEKLTLLEATFHQEDKAKFYSLLRETLNHVSSPYSFLLYLIENHYSNILEGKKSMAHFALAQFDTWRNQGLFQDISPTEMEKDRALWIITTRKLYLFDFCNKVFKLDSKGNEYLQKHVYYLLQIKKRYKEAVTIACKLNLQPCFQPMEILFPLVILNKVQLAESYIANCPWQQRAFVSMLDKLCVMSDEQLDKLTSEIIPAKPSSCKVTQASLTKLGERIVKKFTLDPDDFPELFKAKNVKGLSYLLHQRQKDKGRSSKKWDDLIERCVGNSASLQRSLVDLLNEFGDKEEAKRWERFYQPFNSEKNIDLPNIQAGEAEDWENEIKENEAICSYYDQTRQDPTNTIISSVTPVEQYRPSVEYLTLQIPMEKIHFIDDAESLRWCQRAVSKHGVTIGFDAEWKPQMCLAGLAQRLSIVQLSLRDRVFILDVIALAEKVPEGLILAFGHAVFANENVLKLGYGVESDFRALIVTLPILEKSIRKMKRFVDLCSLSQQLFEMPVMKKKIEKTTEALTSFGHLSEKGLSLLVQQCLGLPLDKTYQLSDWEQRPLLTKQVEYAALDARCLIDLFDVLKKWMIEESIVIDLNECCPRLPWLYPKRSRKTKERFVKHPKPGTSSVELERLNEPAVKGLPNSPGSFRVVVDNMLQGLGRYLRCCGVDVVLLANDDGHDRAAKIARREDRVILTTGTPYYTLRSQVPLGHCMCVPAGSAKEQVLAVFKHFNIQVNSSDIFSRCQVCNGNEYVQVGSVLMRQAYINYYDAKHDGRSMLNTNSLQKSTTLLLPLDVNALTLRSGVKLKIEALHESVLDKVELFYCCATCGKIYWEGGHYSRICAQFSDILNNTDTMYQVEEKTELR